VGANVKQVQEWLGHADPGFTMRTYIHLIDERQEGADFLDGRVQVGNAWATQDPQTAVTDNVAPMANLAH
jgi:hypothetical protein